MNAPLYTTEILRLAASLPEPRKLDRADGSAARRSPTCGSSLLCEVQVKDGRVEALSQTVLACAFGQASAALVAQQAPGRSRYDVASALDQLSAWLSGERDEPPQWPGYEALAPAVPRTGRHGAILLPLRALLGAMESAV
ncbi:MAG: iron-sulfur cluster assembly scaffold protein [Sphingomicrobium sp.]